MSAYILIIFKKNKRASRGDPLEANLLGRTSRSKPPAAILPGGNLPEQTFGNYLGTHEQYIPIWIENNLLSLQNNLFQSFS